MKTVKFAIIGVGNQGNYYARLLSSGELKNSKLVALCDNNLQKLDIARANYGDKVKYFSDYNALIESKTVDAIMVVTPHYFHPEIVIACLKAGINVICDKPAGVYTKQVREMNEVAKNSSALFTVMFNQRTNCVYRKMRELIASGKIGTIQRINWIITDWFRTQAYYDNGSWRATWAGEGGGVLINQCPHQLDLIQWVVGSLPKTVNAFCRYGKWHDIEVEDDVTAYFEYENGASGTFITTTGEAPGTNRFEVAGTLGKLVCENDELYLYENEKDSSIVSKTSNKGFDAPKCQKTLVKTDGKNEQHIGIIKNFVNAILGEEKLFVNGIEGVYGVELMNAIELSGFKGGVKVTLPVDENEYFSVLNEGIKNSKLKVCAVEKIEDTVESFSGSKK